MYTVDLVITKSKRGWHIESIARREGWPTTHTHSGQSTLASALWHSVPDDGSASVQTVTVKGSTMTNSEAYAIIEKCLSKSILSWKLPSYKRALGL